MVAIKIDRYTSWNLFNKWPKVWFRDYTAFWGYIPNVYILPKFIC